MKYAITAVVVILVLLGGVFIITNKDEESSSNNTESTTQPAEQDSSELTSLNKLIERGGDTECSYDFTGEGGNSRSGVAYFSNGDMYGEFTVTKADGSTQQSNILKLDDFQYVWDESKNEGFKIDLTLVKTDESQETDNQGVDQNQEYEFNCKSWDVDSTKFEVPSDVNFIDNSAILNNIQQQTNQVGNVCEQIADPAQRSTCEQSAVN